MGAASPARKPGYHRDPGGRSRGTGSPRRDTARPSGSAPGDRKASGRRKQEARSESRKQRPGLGIVSSELSYFVLIPMAALLLLGLVMVFSAGSVIGMEQGSGAYGYFIQQLIWAGLGMVFLVFFAKLDYHKLGKISWMGVLLSLALLVLVLVVGRVAGGARRWLEIGPFGLQPTEIAKFTLVVFAAYALATKGERVRELKHLIVPVLLITLLEAVLIMVQPDLGSTIVMCVSVFLVMLVAHTRGSHLALIGAAGGTAAAYFMLSAPYRRARLFSFLNPWSCSQGSGYQVVQSYIALGSGNIKGVGLGMSRQKFLYLPNAQTDFIFAVIGEELGIIGTMIVVALIGILVYGGFRIAGRAPDELGKLLAVGITGLIVIQALVNMGGVTGLLPITGVPLPLVSFGGSSLCVCMGCMGILLNVAAQGTR